jgi:hypothetical protein
MNYSQRKFRSSMFGLSKVSWCLLFALGAALLLADGSLAKKRKKVDWDRLDVEELERSWAEGDEPDEVVAAPNAHDPGPAMMFVTLHDSDREEHEAGGQEEDAPAGTERDAVILRAMALGAGFEVMTYSIDESTVLVSTQKGWEAQDILDTVLSYSNVMSVKWNNQVYTRPADEDEL